MVNAYFHMRLRVGLRPGLSEAEISELRWHLGLGPRPLDTCELPDLYAFFRRGHAYHRDDPDLVVDLTERADGGWLLSAWQEPDFEEFDRLRPLFVWLSLRADTTEIGSDGSVPLGHRRFHDESEWSHRIVVCQGYVGFPRIDHRPPLRELVPNADSPPSTWDDLAVRLGSTLARMREGASMTLSAPGNRYAQFAVSEEGMVFGELSSNTYLSEGYRISSDAEAVMTGLGWREPGGENWSWELPMTASPHEYRRVVDATVVALREVLRVAEPRQLSLFTTSLYLGEEVDVSVMGLEREAP